MKIIIIRLCVLVLLALSLQACSKTSVLESLAMPVKAANTVTTKVVNAVKLLSPTEISKTIQSLRADAVKSKALNKD